MGKIVTCQRKGKGSVFRSHVRTRKGAVKLRVLDYAERHGYTKGVVKDIIHDPGRGAPIAKVQFNNAYKFGKVSVMWLWLWCGVGVVWVWWCGVVVCREPALVHA